MKYLLRCKEDDRSNEGLGLTQFISHDVLYKPKENKEYLKDDTLKYRITITSVESHYL